MHEASLVLNILETVAAECRKHGAMEVTRIRLRVGQGSSVVPTALEFAFEAMRRETVAANADLVIEHVPLSGLCDDCGYRFEVGSRMMYQCPACASRKIRIDQGYELQIVDIDIE